MGGFGAGRPFLIVGNSLARLRGACVGSRSCKSQQHPARGCRSASLQARCGTARYGTAQYGPVQPSTPPSSACLPACPGGWFWYGKYLAGQPGRLLDQVLISLAGLVNLKRKKPQDTKAPPRAGRVVALGCAPFLAAIRSLLRSLLELELAEPSPRASPRMSWAEPSRKQLPFVPRPSSGPYSDLSRSSAAPRGMSAYKPRAPFSNSVRERHGSWDDIMAHRNKTCK